MQVKDIVIIFAIDQEYLKKYLSNYFDLRDENKEKFLINYLDKYINLAVYLSQNEEYLSYVDYLLDKVCKRNGSFSFSKGEKDTIKDTINYIEKLLLAPRVVKKVINILIFSKEICVSINKKNEGKDTIDFRDYIV